MKHPENIKALAKLPIDYMGMIFYEKSPRNGIGLSSEVFCDFPASIKRTGVFVNEEFESLSKYIKQYQLDCLQLHGDENPDYCKTLKENYPFIEIIKAFNIAESADFGKTSLYEGLCDFFLFDTKTNQHGGSGIKFDWSLLNAYKGITPFFLSGGISVDDVHVIAKISHRNFYGIDVNSKFEIEPGIKDIGLLTKFVASFSDRVKNI